MEDAFSGGGERHRRLEQSCDKPMPDYLEKNATVSKIRQGGEGCPEVYEGSYSVPEIEINVRNGALQMLKVIAFIFETSCSLIPKPNL